MVNTEKSDKSVDVDGDGLVCNHPDHVHVKSTGERAKDFCAHCSRHFGVTLLKELPCFLITLAAVSFSIPFMRHNRFLEAIVILIIAFGAEYGFSKYFHKKEQAKLIPNQRSHYHFTIKNVFAALTFAAFSWIIHDLAFHAH